MDCVRTIMPYLPLDKQQLLQSMVAESKSNIIRMMDEGWMLKEGNVTVKYLPYDFCCRHLRLGDIE